MSLRADGTYRCDRCGLDVGNGGVFMAAYISDLDPTNPTEARQLHLCREERDDAPRGCVGLVLGDEALADYYAASARFQSSPDRS